MESVGRMMGAVAGLRSMGDWWLPPPRSRSFGGWSYTRRTGASRNVTQLGRLFLSPSPSYPHADSKLEGKTLTCECLLDQERSRRSRRGAGAAGENKPQRSCELEAHAVGGGGTSAEGATTSTPAACRNQNRSGAFWGSERTPKGTFFLVLVSV